MKVHILFKMVPILIHVINVLRTAKYVMMILHVKNVLRITIL